ncbi:MAG TPA: glycosyltransferase family 39 protein [Pirellulaceae bacterium]|nr:glycosyltransferase family 39 protein [Pirellulaceae bacterium]
MDEPLVCQYSPRDHWLLPPILVLATLLRLWQINESLWLDELHSAWVVSAGLGQVAERAHIGNQSPLYFYLLWATTSLFGMSEWALRLPSLVAGIGLVALACGLAYRFTRSPIAAGACAMLAALDHNFLFYATEARPYACVQLIAAVQLYTFWNLQAAAPVHRRVAFVASSVLLFYLHYTAILLVAGEVIYLLTRSWCARQRIDGLPYTCRKLAIDLLCIVALTLPMAAHVFDIGTRRNAWASFVNNTSLLLPANWFSLVSYVVAPLGICLVGAVVCRVRGKSYKRDFEWQPACLLACWLGVPLAIVWLATITKVAPLYLGRYVIGAALAPVLFTGLCVGVWVSRRSQTLVTGLVIAYAVYAGGMIQQFRDDGRLFGDRVENWREAISYVNENRAEDSPVFVRSGLLEADRIATDDSKQLRDYCVLPVTSIYRIDGPASEILPLKTRNAGELTKEDVKRIEDSRKAWFIINGTTATRERCTQRIVESLAKEIKKPTYSEYQQGWLSDERQFGHVGVFAVEIFLIDDQVTPLDDQPTSPNSSAPP